MKKTALFLLVVFCISLTACSKDAEVQAFINEFDATTKDMVAKIDADPSSAGIDEAQKVFESKKASLKEKFDAIKNARGAQVSSEMQKKLTDSSQNNGKMLSDVVTKNASKLAADKDAMSKYRKLMEDYANTFKM